MGLLGSEGDEGVGPEKGYGECREVDDGEEKSIRKQVFKQFPFFIAR
jgi:hypothetical protein